MRDGGAYLNNRKVVDETAVAADGGAGAGAEVHVHVEAELVGVERLRDIQVGDGHDNDFERPVHEGDSRHTGISRQGTARGAGDGNRTRTVSLGS